MDHQTWFDANAGWIGFAGLIVGVLGILTGFLFFWWSRRPKKFGWQLMSKTPILTADAKGLPLKITYAGQHEVSRPNLVVLRFGNRGKVEIRSDDYDRPVMVTFDRAKLIGATLIDGLHLDVNTALFQEANSVTFIPPMLNKGEWLDLQFVTDGPLEVPKVDARIAGQSGLIDELTRSHKRLAAKMKGGGFVLMVGSALSIIYSSIINAPLGTLIEIFGISMLIIGPILTIVGSVWSENNSSWMKQPGAVENIRSDNAIIRLYQGARDGWNSNP